MFEAGVWLHKYGFELPWKKPAIQIIDHSGKPPARPKIYINSEISTEHLSDTTNVLLEDNTKILARILDCYDLYNPTLSEAPIENAIIALSHPWVLPTKLKDKWIADELTLKKLLALAGIINDPETARRRVFERLSSVEKLPNLSEAVGYFTLLSRQTDLLIRKQNQLKLKMGTPKWSLLSWAQTHVLSAATQRRVYAYPATTD